MSTKKNISIKVKFILIVLISIILGEGTYLISLQRKIKYDPLKVALKVCKTLSSNPKKIQCWEDLIDSSLKNQGIEKTFETIENLYATEPIFAGDCHSYVHSIGEKAYKLFSNHQEFSLSPKTSYCGYGFYHAFMESLLKDGGDLAKARQFCDYADKQMSSSIADAKGACYHGIGHGTADNHNQKYWQNEQELVDTALSLCEKVAPDEAMLDRCNSGIFNVMAISYSADRLKINRQDPLWYCRQLARYQIKKPCFEEMNTALMWLASNNFNQAAKFTESIEDDLYASLTIRSLALIVGKDNVLEDDFSNDILTCQSVQERLRSACIRGLVGGLIEGGQPNQQHIKALNFCQNNMLGEEQRKSCYQEALWILSVYYPKGEYQKICDKVAGIYKQFCYI